MLHDFVLMDLIVISSSIELCMTLSPLEARHTSHTTGGSPLPSPIERSASSSRTINGLLEDVSTLSVFSKIGFATTFGATELHDEIGLSISSISRAETDASSRGCERSGGATGG